MKILLTILFVLTALTGGLAQDKDMETKFFNERDKIKEKGIKEMTEKVFQEWKKDCLRDSAKLRLRYSFDKNGNLIQVDDYRGEKIYKTIKYKRNNNGRYYEKMYLHYDSIGKVKFTDNWFFEFDDKNRPIIEKLKRDTALFLTNVLSYDKKGNYIKQVRDDYWEWHFKYNSKGKVIESKECRQEDDSTVCYNFTKYRYEKGLLLAEVKYDPRADTVWKTITYTYDKQNNLTEILDPIKSTSRHNNGPLERNPEFTRFTYDGKGNCISKSLAGKGEEPYRCYFYEYLYY